MTLIVEPRHWREWLTRAPVPRVRARVCIPLLAAVATLACMAVGLRADSNPTVQHGRAAGTSRIADAATYRFPLGCLDTMPFTPASPQAAPVSRAGPCWHYEIYLNAALRHVDRVWPVMPETRSDSCPRVPLQTALPALPAGCINAPVGAGRGRIDVARGLPFTDPRLGVLAGAVP